MDRVKRLVLGKLCWKKVLEKHMDMRLMSIKNSCKELRHPWFGQCDCKCMLKI